MSLPISNSTTTSTSQYHSSLTVLPPSFRLFLNRLSTTIHHVLTHCRPWLEFFDTSSLSRPSSFSTANTRLLQNLSYFKINYLTFLTICLALSLFTHPLSLISLLLLVSAWLLLYIFRPPDQPVVVLGRVLSKDEVGWGLWTATVVVLFFTSVGTVVMWAVMVGVGLACAHGVFREPTLDGGDQERVTFGSDARFKKLVNGGGAQAVGTATARGVVSAV